MFFYHFFAFGLSSSLLVCDEEMLYTRFSNQIIHYKSDLQWYGHLVW